MSSPMLMTLASDVSLTSVMTSLDMGGITRLTTCGSSTYKNVCTRVMPSTEHASYCPTGMDSIPPRYISEK